MTMEFNPLVKKGFDKTGGGGSSPDNVSISRDVNGVIDEWTVDGTTYTPTYTTGLMTSYTDGTSTWTISRDSNNRITGVTKT